MKTSRQVGSLPSRVTLMSLTKKEREEIAEERSQQGKILEEDQENAKDIRLEAMEKLSKKYERGRKRCDEAEKRHDSMMQMFVYQNQLMLSIISKLADK
ncbi:unnamed protein product, partial [Porites lobata]